MNDQEQAHYDIIAKAIDYIKNNSQKQPSLDEIAKNINLNPLHFQRLIIEWAGTSPDKFLDYISVNYAKNAIKGNKQPSLFDRLYETKLSSIHHLHHSFIRIKGMTQAEYQHGGKNLSIQYSFAKSPFGMLIIASTREGVCHMAFNDNKDQAVDNLISNFPNASFHHKLDPTQQNALSIFQNNWAGFPEIKLHIKGTDFQLKVWDSLLKIPMGQLVTYGTIAQQIDKPNASRAVGTAIGSNPIAFLIPCHRVIQSKGTIGGYMWGNTRKIAIIGWEGAKF